MSTVNMMPRQQHQCQYPRFIPVHLDALTNSKRPKKRVAFKQTVTVQPIDCMTTQEEKARSYYSKDELNSISLEVKAYSPSVSQGLPAVSSTCGSHASMQDCLVGLADPALRGLELRSCPIRVRNKIISRKALLKYQQSLNANPTKFSEEAACTKLSRWSKLVAIETARLDSLKVYECDYLIPINDEPVDITPFPNITKRLRAVSDAEDIQRIKRR